MLLEERDLIFDDYGIRTPGVFDISDEACRRVKRLVVTEKSLQDGKEGDSPKGSHPTIGETAVASVLLRLTQLRELT